MIKIAVCDHNKDELMAIYNLLLEFMDEQKIDYELTAFNSCEDLLDHTEKLDIAILDAVIGRQNGIDFGRNLKIKFPEVSLIYITCFEQYVMQAINHAHAYAFLGKPLKKEELNMQLLDLVKNFFHVKLSKEFYNVVDNCQRKYAAIRLNLDDILYFSYIKRRRKVAIVMKNMTYTYDCVFEKLVKELESNSFAVNCRGNLVNLRHVAKIKGYTLLLDTEEELSISQLRINEFKKQLREFRQNDVR